MIIDFRTALKGAGGAPCLKLYHVILSLETFCIEEATIYDFYSIWNHQTLSQLSKHTQDGQIKQYTGEKAYKNGCTKELNKIAPTKINDFYCDLWPSFLMVPKNNNVSLLRYSLSCEIANQAKL